MILGARALSLFMCLALACAGCPYLSGKAGGLRAEQEHHRLLQQHSAHVKEMMGRRNLATTQASSTDAYYDALSKLRYEDIKADLLQVIHTSQDFWPSDFGNYGPLFVRLAWHCAGTYRSSDGRGGCDGGRQRFDPERSWEDNTNLDKARTLLEPVKIKYGLGLSWGDLIQLAGYVAIEDMGLELIGFCAGRVDAPDGTEAFPLGPTEYQELVYPCEENGNCQSPLGAIAEQLIYVNPAGHMGVPVPEDLVPDIRDVFARMGMNDTETVALSGGHAFGKCHGACPAGAGPSPKMDEYNPWPGNCGTGKGNDAFTSGFEGKWTVHPTTWDNDYYQNLLKYDWVNKTGPGGLPQWYPVNKTDPNQPVPDIIMLTSDIALLHDESYLSITELFANDLAELSNQFSHAWYKLTTRDIGPHTRCKQLSGLELPPPQWWQYALPDAPAVLPDYNQVKSSIKSLLHVEQKDILHMDSWGYGPLFVRLAWQCANPFRATDYLGGCNGARIRLYPQSNWSANVDLDKAMELLEGVYDQYKSKGLSWADLIVLAGNVGLEDAAATSGKTLSIPFIGGRVDAPVGELPYPDFLESRLNGGDQDDTVDVMKDAMLVWGLSVREMVALVAGGHTLGKMHSDRSNFTDGSWTTTPGALNTEYLENLLTLKWSIINKDTDSIHYSALKGDATLYMLRTDINIAVDAEFEAVAQEYLTSPDTFYTEFVNAWYKITSADMFGLTSTTDEDTTDVTSDGSKNDLSQGAVIAISAILGALVGGLIMVSVGYFYFAKKGLRGGADNSALLSNDNKS